MGFIRQRELAEKSDLVQSEKLPRWPEDGLAWKVAAHVAGAAHAQEMDQLLEEE